MSLAAIKNFDWQQELFAGLLADRVLLVLVLALVSLGAVMVASSSISLAALPDPGYSDPWFFARRHLVFLVLGFAACGFVACTPLALWRNYGWVMLLAALVVLVLVLIPGIGTEVKGSKRWIRVGPINLQASELAKFCAIIFFASYLSKWHKEIKANSWAILKPLGILLVLAAFILMEPDLGSTVVLMTTVLAMMFIAGIKLWQCFLLMGMAAGAFVALILPVDYRMARLRAFLDPWQDQYGSGYQLVQSLIGFGRGEWFGLGLGNSIQKLHFLPEAHTDFIFSVIAEEFGFLGAVVVIGLFGALIVKAFMLAKEAIRQDNDFACFAAYGVAVLLACQVFINVGVATGLLPTKGLTLPFVSYGGSSLIISMMMMGLLIRVQKELQITPRPLSEAANP
ncbi:putative lipid II flippase FtsW [Halioxenophilus aromaticivorans]|uniref:Probable peptidoglycan glycosyltransferase FtsW n=1 Tax=Halioxenophilus aromaticivorans TaxID=1306992 RepID=A0AAV3TY20_9ALTE